jgi:uncharacterized protein (DUF169 family)
MEVIVNPLNTDLSIYKKFNFQYAPVGIKYLFDKPEGIKKLDKVISFCEMPKEASVTGEAFYMTKENDNCYGKLTLGMEEAPPFAESGQLGVELGIFNEPRANSRYYQSIRKMKKLTVNYVIFAPLDKINFEPDLLFIAANPKQFEIIMRAMTYSTGEIYQNKFTPVFGCSWLFTYPYQSGNVNYAMSILELGIKGKEIYPDDTTMISIPYHWIPIITKNLENMVWDTCQYTDGKENFIKREQTMLENLAKRYLK